MKRIPVALTILFSLSLISCGKAKGRINFVLNGGTFVSPAFSTEYLEGTAGERIEVEIPDCKKEGYFFVGWMEKDKNGKYRAIDKRISDDGKDSYYFYPYGSTTLYAYFEPLVSLQFDLTEGANRGVTLKAPENDAKSFSDNKLNGYVSKKIENNSYLPSVTCSKDSHLTFDYWYTKYPLASSEDENKVKHYYLDTTGTEGVYPFEKSFGNDTMEFPNREKGTSRTLYASWIEDPKITLHYGIEGKEDAVFQGKDNIETELKNIRKTEFSIDYSLKDIKNYYYPADTKDYRFAGFFLDKDYTSPFYRNSPIGSNDFDIYLKWNKKVSLTLDYNGGNVNGKDKETFSDYYTEDILGEDFLKEHTPRKESADFISFTLNGTSFDFSLDALPINQTEVTLEATYSTYPFLTITVDYPNGFTGTKVEAKKVQIKPNSRYEDILNEFKNTVLEGCKEDHLYPKGFYYVDGEGNKKNVSSYNMPEQDFSLLFQLDYEGKRTIESYYNPSSSYTKREDSYSMEKYLGFTKDSQGHYNPDILEEASFPDLKKEIKIDGAVYLYNGLFQDKGRSKPFSFPAAIETSHEERKTLTAYRRRTKAIVRTIVDNSNPTNVLATLNVVPSSQIENYKNQIPSYKKLYIRDGGVKKALSTNWPSTSSTIYLEA